MSKYIDDELIDSAFRDDLNTCMPALRDLLTLIREKPENFKNNFQSRFFTNILSVSRLPEIQIHLLTEVLKILVEHSGISSIPVEKLFDSRNRIARKILTNVIIDLDEEEQEKYVPFIFEIIMDSRETRESEHNFLIDFLIRINGSKVKELCARELSRYDSTILSPIKILSVIGDENICVEFLNILDNTIKGYDYGDKNTIIHSYIINYLQRVKCKKSIPLLFNLMSIYNSSNDYLSVISKALLNNGESALNPLLDFMEEQVTINKMLIIQNLVTALNEIDENILNKIDIQRLLNIVHPEPSKYIMYEELRNIMIKLDESVEPILITMLKSENDREFRFARECLEKRGTDIYQILEKNPFLELYDLIFLELADGKNKIKIQDLLFDTQTGHRSRNKLYFEHGIESLFASCGFSTLWVEPAGLKGLDLIAFSPLTNGIYLIGCTTGTINDDLPKLYETTEVIKEKLDKYEIYTIICTNIGKDKIMRIDEAYSKNIGVLSADEVKGMLDLSMIGRPHEEILNYIRKNAIRLQWR